MSRIYLASEDGCVDHWILADSEERAAFVLGKALMDMNGGPSEAEKITYKELPPTKEVTLCADTLPVKLTVEQWIAVYDGIVREAHLGCSEF